MAEFIEDFIGRETEQEKINASFGASGFSSILIYGRRRIGKTELIKHCMSKSSLKGIYIECKQTSELNNVESLSEIISDTLDFPPLSFKSLEESVEFIFKQSEKESLIFVLDEYPYLRSVVAGLDSILQVLIDKYRKTSKLKFVLCGSYVETMKSLLSKENPLFGRFDYALNVKPMDYYDSSKFYPDYSNEDKVRIFSVFGGIPYYNRLINSKKSVKENIIELIASPGCRLENEIAMYLNSEISKINNANEVFEALAKGFSKFNDILSQSNVTSSPTLADTLEKLIKMDVVKKVAPINDENNKKKSGYFISDPLSLFYYKYIFRNLSRLNVMEPNVFFEKFIQNDFEERYVPKFFEEISTQYLIRKNRKGELENPFERIGKYYYDLPAQKQNGEFDIVTENNGKYIFYEAKFRKDPLDEKMIYEEIKQVLSTGFECEKYGFISKSGFGQIREQFSKPLILISLDEMFL